METPLLVFIDMQEFENASVVRGAGLVANFSTEPVEFRCTSPIRPTKLQQTLWGNRLNGYIAAQLVAKPLLDAIENSVSLVVVRKPEFMEVRPLIEIPVVQILRNEELNAASALGDTSRNDLLESAGGRYEPVVLIAHRDHRDDRLTAKDLLLETFRAYNILEPFSRITNALEVIHQQETKKSGA